MKYQITCDNCGTQFIVEAEEGQTIECTCPHCHGIMEVTLPLVSAGLQYDQSAGMTPQPQQLQAETAKKGNNAILWGVVIGLLLLAGGVGAYYAMGSSSPETTVSDSIPNDTIPYETPVQVEETPSVDTVVAAPEVPKQKEEEQVEENQEEDEDTLSAHAHDDIIEVALDYLSAGLSPEKCTLYIQSQIPEIAELTTFLMNLVSVSRVQRNPTVKTEIKMRNFEANIPMGFFAYPVSQAADIAAFKATTVPAGEDQEPMLELTRELVRRFNQIYAPVLVEPAIMLPENATARRLPGTDGKEKMSKSLGNCIYLSDDADTVWKKVKTMYTDPTHLNVSDPGHVEGNAVFTYLDAFSTDEDFAEFWPEFQNLDELKAAYTAGGIGDMKCKKLLNSVLNKMLDPIRARRHEYEQDIPEIYNILKKGSLEARETAAQTMEEVRAAMQINYFEDTELIQSQAERFKQK